MISRACCGAAPSAWPLCQVNAVRAVGCAVFCSHAVCALEDCAVLPIGLSGAAQGDIYSGWRRSSTGAPTPGFAFRATRRTKIYRTIATPMSRWPVSRAGWSIL